MSKTLTCM